MQFITLTSLTGQKMILSLEKVIFFIENANDEQLGCRIVMTEEITLKVQETIEEIKDLVNLTKDIASRRIKP